MTMKALTIRQPWAYLIIAGHKDIENRSRNLRYRGPLGIHAGTKLSETPIAEIEKRFGITVPREALVFGALIGVADLVDVVTASRSKWFEGPFGYVLANPRAHEPIKMPGKEWVFNLTGEHFRKLTGKERDMKTIPWKPEPRGPGRAFHMFLDAAGERVELLAYDCPASHGGPRMCGFEVYARLRKDGPFHDQVAAGETITLEEAMRAAREMVAKPRHDWAKLPRSWVRS